MTIIGKAGHDQALAVIPERHELEPDGGPREAWRPNRNETLASLRPHFQPTGPKYKEPLLGRDKLARARQKLSTMQSLVHARYLHKQARLKSTSRLRIFKRAQRNKEFKSIAALREATNYAGLIADRYSEAAGRYEALRQKAIPTNADERAAHFEDLRSVASELMELEQQLHQATSILDVALVKRRTHLLDTRHIRSDDARFKLGRRTEKEVLAKWNEETLSFLEFLKHAQTGPRSGLNLRFHEERARIGELENELKQAEANGADLAEILGDGDTGLRTSVALQAVRASEPLSPHLKHALDDNALRSPLEYLGAGAGSVVHMATLEFKDEDGETVAGKFALTPLDSRTNQSIFADERGQSEQQTRAFSRHNAAFEISRAAGLDLVGKARLITVNGVLHMAVPVAPGASFGRLEKTLKRLPPDDQQNQIPQRVRDALHNNVNLQNAAKDTQFFFAVTGHADGHREYVNIQFLGDDGNEVTQDEIVEMVRMGRDDEVSRLKVKMTLFDLDSLFPTLRSVKPVSTTIHRDDQTRIKLDHKKKRSLRVPVRVHYVGPPSFHTPVDVQRLDRLQQAIDHGPTGAALDWYLVRDDDIDEIGALRARIGSMRRVFDEHRAAGRVLEDGTGRALDANGNPVGPGGRQRAMADTAPPTITFFQVAQDRKRQLETLRFRSTRQSLLSKLIPHKPRRNANQ